MTRQCGKTGKGAGSGTQGGFSSLGCSTRTRARSRGSGHRGAGTAVTIGEHRHALHIALGFRVRRDALVLVDRALTGVVTRRGELQVAIEALEQPAQVLDATTYVLPRIKGIA